MALRNKNTFDVETLIEEVRKRPELYDKSLQKYSSLTSRKDSWREICQTVFVNWNELSDEKQNDLGRDLQRKWRCLRDCFVRELRVQRSQTVNPNKFRRQYVHYERLLFLEPYMEVNRNVDGGADDKDASDGSDDDDDQPILKKVNEAADTEYFGRSIKKKNASETTSKSKAIDTEYFGRSIKKKNASESSRKNTESITRSVESGSDQIKVEDKNRDEDIDFAMSLVPMLKRLNCADKLDLKLQILTLFKSNSSTTSDKGGSKPLNDGVISKNKRKRQDSSKQDDKNPLEHSTKSSEDEYAAVGTSVEVKLRRMLSNQRLYAENLINQTLYKGLLVQLSESSKIVTNKRQSERPTFVTVAVKNRKNIEYSSDEDNDDEISINEDSLLNIKTRVSDDSDND